ncbi:MAG: para-nitrobenzyl esterase [Arenicella sp.]|jgi:para-nitrobenzyl esterase
MIKKILLSSLALVVVGVLLIASYLYFNKSPQLFSASVAAMPNSAMREADPHSLRDTVNGMVLGFTDAYNTQVWLGIPYAQAPLGDLRWRAPQPVSNWQGFRDATKYGEPCVQYWGGLAAEDGESGSLLGSEDCLSLNIWAPRLKIEEIQGTKLPVMVWIHGGGNDSGTAKLYQAHHLAGSQNVIVVLINYRLGLLGWFSHQSIRDTASNMEDASGNFGTLDIIQSLKWVRDNIGSFGGDSGNVTIFGESAGGRNVYSMLASPLAKGLFHRAISQSGTVDTTLQALAEDFDDERHTKVVSGLKNSSNGIISSVLAARYPEQTPAQIRSAIANTPSDQLLKILRATDARQLMELASQNTGSPGYIKVARVIRDGHVIPKQSLMTLFNDPSQYNSVPLLTGTNRDEQKVFMARDTKYVSQLLGVLPKIRDPLRYGRVSEYISTNWKAGAVDEPAKLISQTKASPVFAYRFDWDDSPVNFALDLKKLLGASHGMETNYMFGDFQGGMPFGITHDKNNAQGRADLALSMMGYWAEFAYSGDPGRGRSGSLAPWTAWQARGNNIMLLDSLKGGGNRMAEVRTNVADIKLKLASDEILSKTEDRCEAYAFLFLHGYQTSHFWNSDEYSALGCEAYPVGSFRNS